MWRKLKQRAQAGYDASTLRTAIGAVLIAAVAAASGWYARGALEPVPKHSTTQPAVFDQLLEPTACPPRVVGSLVAIGCNNETLAEAAKVRGNVDVISSLPGRMTISGWAADGSKPAKLVLIAVDGKIKFWAKPNVRREDGANYFKKPSMRMTGFDVTVAVPEDFRRSDHYIRVFGVAKNGRAKELTPGPNAK